MSRAIAQVVDAIRNGTAEEVPDFGSDPDIICASCADGTCEIKYPEFYDEIPF